MESLPVEVRRMILDHFSNTELLTIACVNKLFNYEACTLLRDRGNLMAVLNCGNFRDFLFDHHRELMEFLVPFSGIKICWSDPYHRDACPPPHNRLLDPFIIQVRMPLKRLSVQFSDGQQLPKTCLLFQLVRRLLERNSCSLEELEMNERLQLFQFILDVIQDCKFPRLKTVKLIRWSWRRVGGGLINSFIKFTSCKEFLIDKADQGSCTQPAESQGVGRVISGFERMLTQTFNINPVPTVCRNIIYLRIINKAQF